MYDQEKQANPSSLTSDSVKFALSIASQDTSHTRNHHVSEDQTSPSLTTSLLQFMSSYTEFLETFVCIELFLINLNLNFDV